MDRIVVTAAIVTQPEPAPNAQAPPPEGEAMAGAAPTLAAHPRLHDMSPDAEQPRTAASGGSRVLSQPDASRGDATGGRPSVRAATAEVVEAAEESVARSGPRPHGAHHDHHLLRDA